MAVVDLDLYDVFEEAFEMAGEAYHTGYDIRVARRAMTFLMDEWGNRGLNLWTIDSGTIACVADTRTYLLPTDTVDLIDHVLRSTDGLTDYTLRRIAVGEYSQYSSKSQSSRPTSIYIERLLAPQVTLWPVPDAAYTLVYWRLTRISSISSGSSGDTGIPSRFRPALCAGIAKRVAFVRQKRDLIPMLSQEYEGQMTMAMEEDRDRASYNIKPYVARL